MKLTLGILKKSRIPAVIGVCPNDARFAQLVNQAQERLLNRGSWWGTVVRMCVQTQGRFVTWPREVAVVLGMRDACGVPFRIVNGWYVFLEYVNPIACEAPAIQLEDAIGMFPVVQDLPGASRVKYTALNAADEGKAIIVQGIDNNGMVVRTEHQPGKPADGERLVATTAGTISNTVFREITGIIREKTSWPTMLHGWNGQENAMLGYYQPGETIPNYRRSAIRGVACSSYVEALVKLAHVPVESDNDWLVLQNESAFSLAMQSIVAEEAGKDDTALLKWRRAIMELQEELKTMTGERQTVRPVWGHTRTVFDLMYGR